MLRNEAIKAKTCDPSVDEDEGGPVRAVEQRGSWRSGPTSSFSPK